MHDSDARASVLYRVLKQTGCDDDSELLNKTESRNPEQSGVIANQKHKLRSIGSIKGQQCAV